MTDPKLATHPRIAIWESDFSRYVTEHYGRPYNLQQQGDMLAQEASVRFTVPSPYAEDDMPVSLADWIAATPPTDPSDYREKMRWERDYYPNLETVANDLHTKGLLDAGDYIMYAWW